MLVALAPPGYSLDSGRLLAADADELRRITDESPDEVLETSGSVLSAALASGAVRGGRVGTCPDPVDAPVAPDCACVSVID